MISFDLKSIGYYYFAQRIEQRGKAGSAILSASEYGSRAGWEGKT
jgi:hypothetical protein